MGILAHLLYKLRLGGLVLKGPQFESGWG